MRLPWPFGRSTAGPADTTPDGLVTAAAPAPSRPSSTGAWAALPPIQRAIGAPPLVAPSEAFFEAVPGVHPLPPIVEPLGHDVTPVAPAGLVGAPVHVVSSLTSNASLVPPQVQRRAEEATLEAASEPTAPTAAADAPQPAAAAMAGTSSDSAPVDHPARQLGVVTPEAAARPGDRPLTRAEPPAAPANRGEWPLVGRRTQVQASQAAAPAVAPSGTDATSTRSHAQSDAVAKSAGAAAPPPVRRAGLGMPMPAAPTSAVPADAGPLPGLAVARLAASMQTPGAPGIQRPSIAAGTPPPTTVLGGPLSTTPTAGAAALRTTIQRRINGQRTAATEPEPQAADAGERPDLALAAAPRPAASPAPALPVLRVVGEPSSREGPGDAAGRSPRGAPHGSSVAGTLSPTPTGSGASAGPSPTVTRSVGTETLALPARPQRRPLAGSQPIGQVGTVQREASTDAAAVTPPGGGSTASVGGSSTPSVAPFGGLPLERPGFGEAWTLAGGWEQPQPISAGTGAAVQRQGSPARSVPGAPATDRGPAWGSTGGSRPPDAQSAPMTLARPAAPVAQGGAPGPAASPAPGVARSIVSEVAAPSVQASPLSAGMVQGPVFGPTATPVVQRIDGSAPPPAEPKGASERSDDELDELARSLFGRLRVHLRNEYIYEREAKGLTFDQS